jgi:DNA-binding transcriptional MerR regulator
MDGSDVHLSIQQVAEYTGLSAHTLRYYERIGLIEPVTRAGSGHRRYTEDDVGWIEFLKKLRSTGMPIREMKRYADLLSQGPDTIGARRALLEAHQHRIEENLRQLTENLAAIKWKVAHYRECEQDLQPSAEQASPTA